MKLPNILTALALAAILGVSFEASAQTAVTTTTATESAGTISDFSPDVITIRSESSPAPVTYRYTKTTTYVDDTGAPVSIETVKSGLPVTVHYVRDGDRMIANRIIVHRRAAEGDHTVIEERKTTTPAVIEEHKSSTTTTTTTDRK